MKVKYKSELLFRRAFIPWYDTEPAMVLTLAFALAVLLFSITGIAASLDTPRYQGYIWVPCLLGILSLAVTISLLIRLIRRGY
ncbi:MAG: hypothetical protein V2I40_02470 [Desulfobacteraceae bacterium]|nr:hypothetical protein [Desulfobacteraceae bacterium]